MRLGAVLLASAVVTMALSGCVEGGDGKGKAGPSGPGTGAAPTRAPPVNTGDLAITDPKRHFHHYWGDGDTERASVVIFEGTVTLQQDAFRGSEFGCTTVGHTEFDLESDGDDVRPDSPPVNPDNGRADTVFAGTAFLQVELVDKDPNLVGDLYFRYKPANLNAYLPESGCGIKMVKGAAINITVGRGAADPPHQFAVSRWSFFVIAANDVSGAEGPTVGQGEHKIRMTAFNGGEANLDPAHPDLYGSGSTYDLGCVKQENVEQQVVVWWPGSPAHLPPREPLSDVKFPYGKIVPLLTQKVVVKFTYTYTGTLGSNIELWYFGGDTNRYAPAPKKEGSNDEYEILDPSGLKADPPYLDETLWRFMVLPRSAAMGPDGQSVADFAGSFELCAVAHKDPNAVLS